jgi:hypothetical protein
LDELSAKSSQHARKKAFSMAQPIFLQTLFEQFEPAIREVYGKAARDAAVDPQAVPLELTVVSWRFGRHEAEFAALPGPPRVAITWNGIASLWAIGHAIARVGRVMFEAQRKLALDDDRKLMLRDYPVADMELSPNLGDELGQAAAA